MPRRQAPTSAQIPIGSFSFAVGKADKCPWKTSQNLCLPGYILMIPEDETWSVLIEQKQRAERFWWYAIKKRAGCIDREQLQRYIDAPSGYTPLPAIDGLLYEEVGKHRMVEMFHFPLPTTKGPTDSPRSGLCNLATRKTGIRGIVLTRYMPTAS